MLFGKVNVSESYFLTSKIIFGKVNIKESKCIT